LVLAVAAMAVACFLILSVHEVLHLVLARALGGTGSLGLVRWKSQLSGLITWGLHVGIASISSAARPAVALGGPLGAAAIAYALERASSSPAWRLAFCANVRISLFYAAAEGMAPLLAPSTIFFQVLSSPELNYGVPSAIALVLISGMAGRRRS